MEHEIWAMTAGSLIDDTFRSVPSPTHRRERNDPLVQGIRESECQISRQSTAAGGFTAGSVAPIQPGEPPEIESGSSARVRLVNPMLALYPSSSRVGIQRNRLGNPHGALFFVVRQ